MNTWTQSFLKGTDGMGADDSIDTRDLVLKPATPRTEERNVETEAPKPAQPDNEAKHISPLVDALDRIEASWIAQLDIIKRNAETLEAKIKACVITLRQDMARLELLGQQAMKEAERGQKVTRHFAASLDQIKGGR